MMTHCFVASSGWRLSKPISCLLGFGLLFSVSHSAQSPANDPFADSPPSQASVGSGFSELSNAGDLLAEDEGLRRVAAQQLEAQVKSELTYARHSRDPSATKLSLKALQDQIRRATELDASGRNRLESQVASAIQAAARSEVNLKEQLSMREAVQSSQSASKRLIAETERRNSTVQQLVERYNSLMAHPA